MDELHEQTTEHTSGLITVSALLKLSWQEARKRYAQLFLLNFLPGLAVGAAALLGFLLWRVTGMWVVVGVYGLVVLVLGIAISTIAQAASIRAASLPANEYTLSQLFSKGVEPAGTLFFVSLAYGLLVGLGLVLLIVPGIYFGLKYSMAMFVAVEENTSFAESFTRSAEYTKGHLWEVFTRAFFYVLILGFIYVTIGAIMFDIARALHATPEVRDNIETILQLFLAPWYITYGVLLYGSLKKLRHQHY